MNWTKLERSERLIVAQFEADVWPTGDGARFTVMDGEVYRCGGRADSILSAKVLAENFIEVCS